jgi:hypothetical protein
VSQEREPRPELDREIVAAYAATFIPRFDVYPIQLPNGAYVSVKKPLNTELVAAHLTGSITLGAYALDAQSRAKWICLDADNDDNWQGLLDLAHDLEQEQVPAYLELSRRGGHLWLFLEAISGKEARRFGKQLLFGRGLSNVELYPKQDELKTGTGSLVRLPLGCHRLTGKRYHFINPDGEPLAPTIRAQIQLLAQPQRVPHAFITEVLRYASDTTPPPPTPPFPSHRDETHGATPSERIKNHISVYDFVSRYVPLDASGRSYCPFHDDQRKSFAVNEKGNYWHCFAGCGGGSVIDFWLKWRETHGQSPDFNETITELAQMLL